ncbi:MAG: murein biosynthesis integral membrane protein MurJ [Deltaproteobacteria bacterium]|nr:murein biosynthesis integral membrane protein MurJ [Deltaproteobacteria bacterium]
MSKSLYQKVGIASLILMASVFLSRVIGLFREMAIAYAGGARGDVDAYQIAFVIPEILNSIVASGFLSVTFIPIFSGYLAADREEEGWKVFSLVLNSFGSLLILFIGISIFFAPELMTWIAPGIKDPILLAKAVRMTRIILPAQFFFFTGGMFTAVQFAKEAFTLPALAPLIYNIGIIAGGMALGPVLKMEGFSWGVLAGSFLGNFAVQYRGALKVGMKYSPDIGFTHPDFIAYIRLTLPLMLGLTMSFSTEFFLKFFGSYLPEGSIACLNYGLRIMFILVGLLGQAVGIASFPYLARLAAENQIPEMNRLLNRTLKYLSVIIPFSMLFMVLRHEMVAILFERGRFDAAATTQTAGILVYLMMGAFAFAAQTIVVRGYYAMQNTIFPAIYSTIGVLISVPFYILGMKLMGAAGVALAISVSAILQVILLYTLWNRRSHNPECREVYRGYAKMLLLSIPAGLILEGLRMALARWTGGMALAGSLLIACGIGLVFLALLLAAGYLFKIREITETLGRLFQKAI